jgi:hypothetical protein
MGLVPRLHQREIIDHGGINGQAIQTAGNLRTIIAIRFVALALKYPTFSGGVYRLIYTLREFA